MKDHYIIIVVIIILSFFLCTWFYRMFKVERKRGEQISKENSILLADNALLEVDHLRFQLQPHTINNILANLKLLANKLNRGMDSLSETLDYVLYKGDTHLVTVQDEINFIQKYLALNDLFISEIDAIKFDNSNVDTNCKHFKSACVPHLITGYFIENAFKHGDVNHPQFLNIRLTLSNTSFEMIVTNRIRQKPNPSKGGIGLVNMEKRLELLMSGKYQIKNNFTDNHYYSTLIISL